MNQFLDSECGRRAVQGHAHTESALTETECGMSFALPTCSQWPPYIKGPPPPPPPVSALSAKLGEWNTGATELNNRVWMIPCRLSACVLTEISGCSTHKQFRKYGESSVNLYASEDNTHWQTSFSKTGKHWPTTGPTSSFMRFPQSPWSCR